MLCAPWNGFILDRHKRGKTPRPEGNPPAPLPHRSLDSGRAAAIPAVPAVGIVAGATARPDAAVPAGALGTLADLRASVLSLVVTVTQCVLFSICAAVPVLPVQFGTFVLQVLSRSFLYGGNAAFLAIA